MNYKVVAFSTFNAEPTALGLQGLLNGWVQAHALELVTIVPFGDDWLVVLKED